MAVLYALNSSTPRTLLLHLGPSTCHTVYKAKIAATILALELLCTELHCMLDASIVLDNCGDHTGFHPVHLGARPLPN